MATQNKPAPKPRVDSDEKIKNFAIETGSYESFKPKVYRDNRGYLTIGHGFNLDDAGTTAFLKNQGYNVNDLRSGKAALNKKESTDLLNLLFARSYDQARNFVPNFDTLPEKARYVLADMTYNMGLSKLAKFKQMKAAFENNNFNEAAKQLKDSDYYDQVGRRSRAHYNELLDLTAKTEPQLGFVPNFPVLEYTDKGLTPKWVNYPAQIGPTQDNATYLDTQPSEESVLQPKIDALGWDGFHYVKKENLPKKVEPTMWQSTKEAVKGWLNDFEDNTSNTTPNPNDTPIPPIFKRGGKISKESNSPTYNPLDDPRNKPTVYFSKDRSNYDPLSNNIYFNPNNNPWNPEDILKHEGYHWAQNMYGDLQAPDLYPGPLRKPQTPTNPNTSLIPDYYNRAALENQVSLNYMKEGRNAYVDEKGKSLMPDDVVVPSSPSLQFIPNDVIWRGVRTDNRPYNEYTHIPGADALRYNTPDTIEGDAKYYEDTEPISNKPIMGIYGLEDTLGYKHGGLIKRADGSYSRRGLWDNIRANRGSGRKPTAEMLRQERKIKKHADGGWVNMYANGSTVKGNKPPQKTLKQSLLNYKEGADENKFELLDPTGILSWDDAAKGYDSWQKSGRTLPTLSEGLDMFSAIPIFGKAKQVEMGMKEAANASKWAIDWWKAYHAADYLRDEYNDKIKKHDDGSWVTDSSIPTPTTPSYYPAGEDRTLTNYQMGTLKAPMYASGGGVKPIYVTSKNDPRLKAYNDSLSLYKENFNQLRSEKLDFTPKFLKRIPFNIKNDNMYAKDFFERNDMWDRRSQGEVYPEKIKPIYFDINQIGDQTQHSAYYKKPVQPIIYRKEEDIKPITSGVTKAENVAFPTYEEELKPMAPIPQEAVRRMFNPAFDFNIDFMPNRTKEAVVDQAGNPRYKYYNQDNVISESEYNNLMKKADGGSIMYGPGGGVQPFITSDPNLYKQRLQAYNDSVYTHNLGLANLNYAQNQLKQNVDKFNAQLPSAFGHIIGPSISIAPLNRFHVDSGGDVIRGIYPTEAAFQETNNMRWTGQEDYFNLYNNPSYYRPMTPDELSQYTQLRALQPVYQHDHYFPYERKDIYHTGYIDLYDAPKQKVIFDKNAPPVTQKKSIKPLHPKQHSVEIIDPIKRKELNLTDLALPTEEYDMQPVRDVAPQGSSQLTLRMVPNPKFNVGSGKRSKEPIVDQLGNPRNVFYNRDKVIGKEEYNKLWDEQNKFAQGGPVMYNAGSTVWTNQDTPLWAAGTSTPTATQHFRNTGSLNTSKYKIGDVIPTGMNYKTPSSGTHDYNQDVQPPKKMVLHAPDTTIMAKHGGQIKKHVNSPRVHGNPVNPSGMSEGPSMQRGGMMFADGGGIQDIINQQLNQSRPQRDVTTITPKNLIAESVAKDIATYGSVEKAAQAKAIKKSQAAQKESTISTPKIGQGNYEYYNPAQGEFRDDTKIAPEGSTRATTQDYLNKANMFMGFGLNPAAKFAYNAFVSGPAQSAINLSNTAMGNRPIRGNEDFANFGWDVANVLPYVEGVTSGGKNLFNAGKNLFRGARNANNAISKTNLITDELGVKSVINNAAKDRYFKDIQLAKDVPPVSTREPKFYEYGTKEFDQSLLDSHFAGENAAFNMENNGYEFDNYLQAKEINPILQEEMLQRGLLKESIKKQLGFPISEAADFNLTDPFSPYKNIFNTYDPFSKYGLFNFDDDVLNMLEKTTYNPARNKQFWQESLNKTPRMNKMGGYIQNNNSNTWLDQYN